MARQALKNHTHHVIGYIDTCARTGRQTLLDERYHRLAYYDPNRNETTDEHHRRVGTGNLLTACLPAAR